MSSVLYKGEKTVAKLCVEIRGIRRRLAGKKPMRTKRTRKKEGGDFQAREKWSDHTMENQ